MDETTESGNTPDGLRAGLATSIGSLPHDDPVAAAELVLRCHPELPTAPSLPALDQAEGMLAQAAWGMPGVAVREGVLHVDETGIDPKVEPTALDLGAPPWVALSTFLDRARGRTDPVKVQITGPVTLGRALHDAGVPVPDAFEAAGRVTRRRAEELMAALGDRLPGTPLVAFVDEPGLVGSSHPRFPLDREHVVDLISGVLAPLEAGATTGLHCCGAADWGMAVAAGPRVLSAPLDAGLAFVPDTVSAFLDSGGWIAWGAVPTDEPVGTTGERLFRRVVDVWCGLVRGGCDAMRLRERAIITPACGLAMHGTTQAERILDLTSDIAERVGQQAMLARLSVGA